MTKEIIETILSIEKQADELVQKAKEKANDLAKQTEQDIQARQAKYKQELKELKIKQQNVIQQKITELKKSVQEEQKANLDRLKNKAEKNIPKVLDYILGKLTEG